MSDSGGQAGTTQVILPYSLTDIAKSIREIVAALREIGTFFGDSAEMIDRRRARTAARKMSDLSFGPGGSLGPLERISAGQGQKSDYEELRSTFDQSAEIVDEAIALLGRYRDRVREKFGMAVAQKLDQIIYGDCGKRKIRALIMQLLGSAETEGADSAYLQSEARRAVEMIETVNRQLIDLHDMILPAAAKK